MDKKKGSLFSKLKDRYRINIINPDNFEEISSFNGNWIQVLMIVSTLFILSFALSIVVLLYTPLNNYFTDTTGRMADPRTIQLSALADSLQHQLGIQAQYIDNQLAIFKGEDDRYAKEAEENIEKPNKEVDESSLFHISPEDSGIRKEMESYAFSLGTNKPKNQDGIHFYPPVNGIVNARFNPDIKHYAVDLISEKEAPIKSTLDGTVIFSEFSSTTGYVIVIQHLNNYISIYKHNSVLLKQVGNFVRAGETVAIIGNSGEMTTGPHLHFELWQNGRPIDPENFIVF